MDERIAEQLCKAQSKQLQAVTGMMAPVLEQGAKPSNHKRAADDDDDDGDATTHAHT